MERYDPEFSLALNVILFILCAGVTGLIAWALWC